MVLSLDFTNADRGASSGILGGAIQDTSPFAGKGPDTGIGFGTDGMGGNIWGKGGMASMAVSGLQTLGSIWSSFKQFKLAKDSLKFQKDAFKTNLENSQKVYNTALEDRIRARYVAQNQTTEEADAKIAENRLG